MAEDGWKTDSEELVEVDDPRGGADGGRKPFCPPNSVVGPFEPNVAVDPFDSIDPCDKAEAKEAVLPCDANEWLD